MNLLMYMAPVAVAFLLPAALLMEENVVNITLALARDDVRILWYLIFNSALAYLVNLTNFLVTKHTSALTLQVCTPVPMHAFVCIYWYAQLVSNSGLLFFLNSFLCQIVSFSCLQRGTKENKSRESKFWNRFCSNIITRKYDVEYTNVKKLLHIWCLLIGSVCLLALHGIITYHMTIVFSCSTQWFLTGYSVINLRIMLSPKFMEIFVKTCISSFRINNLADWHEYLRYAFKYWICHMVDNFMSELLINCCMVWLIDFYTTFGGYQMANVYIIWNVNTCMEKLVHVRWGLAMSS